MNKRICHIAATIALSGFAHSALAASYSAIYAFGDSFSDTGNLVTALGTLPADDLLTYWPPFAIPGYANGFNEGRPTNGRSAIEHFANALGLGGNLTNYSYTGALSGRGNVLPFVNTEIGATGLRDQVDVYLDSHGSADPDALYFVWGGHNDLWGLGQALPPSIDDASRGQALTDAGLAGARNIADDVSTLIRHGAKNIFVANSVALEYEPFWDDFTASDGALRSLIHGGVTAMNTELDLLLSDLQAGFADGNIITFDTQAWYEDTIARVLDGAGPGGLSNASDACFAYDGAQFAACQSPGEYFFWDSIHPSDATYSQLAQGFVGRLGATAPVPEPLSWQLVVAGLLVLSILVRRKRGTPGAGFARHSAAAI